MLTEFRNIKSTKKELRSFSIIFFLVSFVIAWYSGSQAVYFLILAGGFALAAIFTPKFIVPLHKVWMGVGIILGAIVSRIILILVFFLVVTPIGILAKLFGKDFLKLKLDKPRLSYWEYREKQEAKEDYLKQF